MTRHSKALILVALLLFVATPASAQVANIGVFGETACNGPGVILTVTVNITGDVDPDIVGWVVDRETLGACVDDVQIGEIQPIPPVGTHEFQFVDQPDVPDRQTIYRIRGVDAQGTRIWIGWGRRTLFAQADCVGGPAARGTVQDLFNGLYHVEVCPDECGWARSYFDGVLDASAVGVVGEVVDVYGQLQAGMEGPFVYEPSWVLSTDGCTRIVPTDTGSWGSMKGMYR